MDIILDVNKRYTYADYMMWADGRYRYSCKNIGWAKFKYRKPFSDNT